MKKCAEFLRDDISEMKSVEATVVREAAYLLIILNVYLISLFLISPYHFPLIFQGGQEGRGERVVCAACICFCL